MFEKFGIALIAVVVTTCVLMTAGVIYATQNIPLASLCDMKTCL